MALLHRSIPHRTRHQEWPSTSIPRHYDHFPSPVFSSLYPPHFLFSPRPQSTSCPLPLMTFDLPSGHKYSSYMQVTQCLWFPDSNGRLSVETTGRVQCVSMGLRCRCTWCSLVSVGDAVDEGDVDVVGIVNGGGLIGAVTLNGMVHNSMSDGVGTVGTVVWWCEGRGYLI